VVLPWRKRRRGGGRGIIGGAKSWQGDLAKGEALMIWLRESSDVGYPVISIAIPTVWGSFFSARSGWWWILLLQPLLLYESHYTILPACLATCRMPLTPFQPEMREAIRMVLLRLDHGIGGGNTLAGSILIVAQFTMRSVNFSVCLVIQDRGKGRAWEVGRSFDTYTILFSFLFLYPPVLDVCLLSGRTVFSFPVYFRFL